MNDLFPGRPDYVGPTKGYFAFLNHKQLFESSHDVMERVAYVKREKPGHEIQTRLHNMIYLPFMTDELYADYEAKRASLDVDYEAKLTLLYADYEAKLAPLYADYEAKLASLRADYEAKLAPLRADYEAKLAPLRADYLAKLAPLRADYKAKLASLYVDILTFVRQHIPDCAWNGRELVFPEAA